MSIYVFIIFCSGLKFVVFVFTKQRNKSSFLVINFDSLQCNLPIHDNRILQQDTYLQTNRVIILWDATWM